MTLNLSITICVLNDLHWQSRFPGQDNPAFYISLKHGDSTVKTEAVRGRDARWYQRFIFCQIKKTQTIRFRLKVVMPYLKNRVIGEIEYSAEALLGLFSPPYNSISLRLRDVRNPTSIHVGIVEVRTRILDDKQAAGESLRQAFWVVPNDVNEALQPDTVLGKIWQLFGKLDTLSGIIGKIDQVAKLNGYLDFAWQMCSVLYKAIDKQYKQDQKVFDILQTISDSFDFAKDVEMLKSDMSRLSPIIQRFLNQIAECAQFIHRYLRKSFGGRLIGLDYDNKIKAFEDAFTQLRGELLGQIHLQTAFVTSKILGDMSQVIQQYNQIYNSISQLDQSTVLRDLNPSTRSVGDRPTCLHGTREAILQEAVDWCIGDSSEHILWIHGLAGSGKSTIMRTLSERLHGIGRRGAFVFFERGMAGHDAFVRTIASQLANADPLLRPLICAAVEKDRSVITDGLDRQFECLLEIPLRDAAKVIHGPIVILIDALDEYGDEVSRSKLLELISVGFTQIPRCFRFIVTSRLESDIEASLCSRSTVRPLSLKDEKDSVSAIHLYLSTMMAQLHRKRKNIPSDWPSEVDLSSLAAMSEGIFVWATTLYEFLLTSAGSPVELMEEIISTNGRHADGLDQLYATVLSTQIKKWDANQISKFRAVVGAVLFSRTPLCDVTIDGIVGLERDSCSFLFERLRSLFDYDPKWPVRPLHASFRDYLTDAERSGGCKWTLADFDAHNHLAMCCFNVMRKHLCVTETPALTYASEQWYHHLSEVSSPSPDLVSSFQFYSTRRFIQWMETRPGLDYNDLQTVQSIALSFIRSSSEHIRENNASHLTELWVAFGRFIERYCPLLEKGEDIYLSGFLFPQPSSILKSLYTPTCMKPTLSADDTTHIFPQLRRIGIDNWDDPYLSATPSDYFIFDVTKSEALLGSCKDLCWHQFKISRGTWTYKRLIDLPGPTSGGVHCVAVSPDLTRFVVSDHRKSIPVYDANSRLIKTIEIGDQDTRVMQAFHPIDPDVLALWTTKGTVRIWDISRNMTRICFDVPASNSVKLPPVWSADGTYLVLPMDSKVRVWKINMLKGTADEQCVFNLRAFHVWPSPTNPSHLLIHYKDGVYLFNIQSTQAIRDYECRVGSHRNRDFKNDFIATFSPDGSLIAASFKKKYFIKIFNAATGKCQDCIWAPDQVRHIVFLSNQDIAAFCGGDDNGLTIRTWDFGSRPFVNQCREQTNTGCQVEDVTSLQISAHGTFLVSSLDGTFQIRDVMNCELIQGSSRAFPLPVLGAVFGLDGDSFYLGLGDGTIHTSAGTRIYPSPDDTDQQYVTKICKMYVYETPSHEEKLLVCDEDGTVMTINGAPDHCRECWEFPSPFDPSMPIACSKWGLVAFHQDLRSLEPESPISESSSTTSIWDIVIIDMNSDNTHRISIPMEGIPEKSRGKMDVQSMTFTLSGDKLVILVGEQLDGEPFYFKEEYLGIWHFESTTFEEQSWRWLTVPDFKVGGGDENSSDVTTSPDDTWLFLAARNYGFIEILMVDLISGELLRRFKFLVWPEIGCGAFRIAVAGDRLIFAAPGGIVTWDLTVVSEVGECHTLDSSPRSIHSSTMPSTWKVPSIGDAFTRGGWIEDSDGERMFWAPDDILPYLDPPGSCHVIKQRRAELNTTHLMHGGGLKCCPGD